jgi:hypothetical protein
MKTATRTAKPRKKRDEASEYAAGYNAFKEFEGQRYTGMKVGRGHKWYYDRGEWKEKKITPDKWEFSYAVTKRRAGRAPEGSGVPVGTEYHWYIVAHQNVRKLNANDYDTSMAGLKFKVAHRRADTGKWSASDRAQRRRLIKLLQEMIDDLQQQLDAPDEPAAAPGPNTSNRNDDGTGGNGRHNDRPPGSAKRRAARAAKRRTPSSSNRMSNGMT